MFKSPLIFWRSILPVTHAGRAFWWRHRAVAGAPGWLGVGVLALLLLPLIAILAGSVFVPVAGRGDSMTLSLHGWREVISQHKIATAAINTVSLTLVSQIISLPVSVLIAWLVGRTDLPGRSVFEFCFWLSFFLPSLAVLQGWVLMFDPFYGISNMVLSVLSGSKITVFDIYSYPGIVFAHLMTTTVSAKVMMLTPAFKLMNSRLEDAAYSAGDSHLGVLTRVTLPLLAPLIVVTLLIGIARGLESFELELVLGGPPRIDVINTLIYGYTRSDPVDYASACALGVVETLSIAIIVTLGRRWSGSGDTATISGQTTSAPIPLRALRPVATLLVGGIAVLLTVVPLGFLLASSFMTRFGFFSIPHAWTLGNWRSVLADPAFFSALRTTLEVAAGGAALCVVGSFALAYAILRSRGVTRLLLSGAAWMPFMLPGILFSLAILWIILQTGLVPLYGSTVLLMVVIALASLTLGVQMLKANLTQITREMEEAAKVAGSSPGDTLWRVILPLCARSLAVVLVMAFIDASRNIGHLSLLVSSDNQPLSLLQLGYMIEGRSEASSVVGVIIVTITVAAALIVRSLSTRFQGQP